MKITSVDIMMLEAEAPENRGRNTPVFCRIHTDEGIFGDGEAGVMMMTGARAACAMLEELSPSLIGQDPIDGEVLLESCAEEPISDPMAARFSVPPWQLSIRRYGI